MKNCAGCAQPDERRVILPARGSFAGSTKSCPYGLAMFGMTKFEATRLPDDVEDATLTTLASKVSGLPGTSTLATTCVSPYAAIRPVVRITFVSMLLNLARGGRRLRRQRRGATADSAVGRSAAAKMAERCAAKRTALGEASRLQASQRAPGSSSSGGSEAGRKYDGAASAALLGSGTPIPYAIPDRSEGGRAARASRPLTQTRIPPGRAGVGTGG